MPVKSLLGFDIGGTKCAAVIGVCENETLRIEDRIEFATETSRGPEYALARLEQAAKEMERRHGPSAALGISCGGPLDSTAGVILGPPNLPGWDHVEIVRRFEDRLGIPAKVQNDANACALAEWKWGAGRGTRNMVFLTFGTGLGAGLILDGKLYTGTNDLAGEIGHVRLANNGPTGYGKAGSFEGFCSGGGIADLARIVAEKKRANGTTAEWASEEVNARRVFELAAAGDETAREVVAECARHLGRGLAIIVDILNPECIVIGSIFARQQEALWPITHDELIREALEPAAKVCRVVAAELGEQIGDYACLSVASAAIDAVS